MVCSLINKLEDVWSLIAMIAMRLRLVANIYDDDSEATAQSSRSYDSVEQY